VHSEAGFFIAGKWQKLVLDKFDVALRAVEVQDV
jgi:hypothetical protein